MLRQVLAGAVALAMGFVSAAEAADLPSGAEAPVLPVPATWSPWMVRARVLGVIPDESATVSSGGARLAGAKVDISASAVPELDITYFFTRNLAAELILGVTRHQVTGAGTLADTRIGNTWLLPPTLTLQYHFDPIGPIKPYIGVGVNYTVYFDEEARGTFNRFRLKNTVGLALQAGLDYMLDEHWGLNLDLKKIFMDPDVSIDRRTVVGRVHIDPWIVGTGVAYRF